MNTQFMLMMLFKCIYVLSTCEAHSKNLMDAPYMKMTAIDYVSVQISHQLPETYVRA